MFKQELYEVVRGAVSKDVVALLDTEFDLVRKMMHYVNQVPEDVDNAFADETVDHSFAFYSPMCFEALSQILLPRVEEIVGRKLHQSFTYSRIYYKGSILNPHLDRPSCEYSISLCISKDEEFGTWPIYYKDRKNQKKEFLLEPGDMIVYKGDRLLHWRLQYEGKRHCQAFMHYVDQEGPHAELKYDGRVVLGTPRSMKMVVKD